MKKFLGIIGGVGPESTAYFYKKIIKMTKAVSDQEHIDMVILNHATIPNRNEYILDHTKPNPYPDFLEDIKILKEMGTEIISIPCNTAHYFYEKLQAETSIKILNLIEDTAIYIKEKNIKKVGIWATSATIKSELYQKELAKLNIEFVIPSEQNQQKIMHIIYDNIKAETNVNKEYFDIALEEMFNKKVEAVIMGCTELSMLKEIFTLDSYFVDPLEIQAEIIIKHFGKEVNYK
jgi:aspartate racemase